MTNLSGGQQRGQFDPLAMAQTLEDIREVLRQNAAFLGRMMELLREGAEQNIRKEYRNLYAGQDYTFNFKVMSAYVNAAGSEPLVIVIPGGIEFSIAAGQSGWIHPVGVDTLTVVSGQGSGVFLSKLVGGV